MGQFRGAIGAVALASAAVLSAPVVAQDVPAAQVAPPPPGTAIVAAPRTETPRSRHHHAKGDPLEGFNRAMFKVFKVLDRFLYRPVAIAYKAVIPKLVRTGVRHVFSNATEPIVLLNDVLQLKPKRAIRTLGRLAVNSTIGLGGIFDVAKTSEFDLPHHDNGFGNTLGRYGIGPGPYLFLPIIGPSSFRDLIGDGADGAVLPYAVGTPFDRSEYQVSQAVLTGLDQRAEADQEMRALESGAVDPYATLRSAYQQNRAAAIAEIRHGSNAPPEALDDPLADPDAAVPGKSTSPAPLPADDALVDPAAPAPPPATPKP